MNKIEKQLKISQEVSFCYQKISRQLSTLPSFKKGWLKKSYNRRPMRKKKTAKAMASIVLDAIFASISIARILSMPIPKHDNQSIV